MFKIHQHVEQLGNHGENVSVVQGDILQDILTEEESLNKSCEMTWWIWKITFKKQFESMSRLYKF